MEETVKRELKEYHAKLDRFTEELKLNCAKINLIHEFLANQFGVEIISSHGKWKSYNFQSGEIQVIVDSIRPQHITSLQRKVSSSENLENENYAEPYIKVKHEIFEDYMENSGEDVFLKQPRKEEYDKADFTSSISKPSIHISGSRRYKAGKKQKQSSIWAQFITIRNNYKKITSNTCRACNHYVSPKVERLRDHIQSKCEARTEQVAQHTHINSKPLERFSNTRQRVYNYTDGEHKLIDETQVRGNDSDYIPDESEEEEENDDTIRCASSNKSNISSVKTPTIEQQLPSTIKEVDVKDYPHSPDSRLGILYSYNYGAQLGRRKSMVWDHFDVEYSTVLEGTESLKKRQRFRSCTCKKCGSNVSPKIERLREHIQFKCTGTKDTSIARKILPKTTKKPFRHRPRAPDIWSMFITTLKSTAPDNSNQDSRSMKKYASAVCRVCEKNVSPRIYRLREHLQHKCPGAESVKEESTSGKVRERITNQCEECGKVLVGSLSKHMLVHTGARPYQCPICGKSFKRGHHMKFHKLTVHDGIKMLRKPRVPVLQKPATQILSHQEQQRNFTHQDSINSTLHSAEQEPYYIQNI